MYLEKLQYLHDEDGNPTAVIVPIEEWNRISNGANLTPRELEIVEETLQGYQESQLMMEGKLPKKLFKDVINEL